MRVRCFFLTLVLLLVFAGDAAAYTLGINLKPDRIWLRMPPQMDQDGFAQEDLTIEVEARGMGGRPWHLSLLPMEDMLGPMSVPASEITWKALTSPFIDGTLVKGVPQLLAQGVGDANIIGRIKFMMKPGNIGAGTYDLRLRVILSSP